MRLLYRLLFAGFCSCMALVNTNAQNITTVAGNGFASFSGDGGPAITAELNGPCNTAIDPAGNIYIADATNWRIRKVNAGTGIINTVAGTGINTFSGDGGAATSAGVGSPQGVAVDAAGNYYLADFNNNRVRKTDGSTGIITTVAGNGSAFFSGDGGQAASAGLQHPVAVALNPAGTFLYIADAGNNSIRKVDLATGIISTVAGTGNSTGYFTGDGGAATAARLNSPASVAVDAAGNFYIADYNNYRIRKVTAATGIITTIAGSASSGATGDGGPASGAKFNGPNSVALDAAGNLLIADAGNYKIRKIDLSSNIITTVAGTGAYDFGGDGGLATAASFQRPVGISADAAGNFYVSDNFTNRVRKVDGITGIITTVAGWNIHGDGGNATSASLSNAQSTTSDAAGNLYIADYGNYEVRKVDANTGIITTVAGTGISGYTGDGGPAVTARIDIPASISIDSAGDLLIGTNSYLRSRIRKVNLTTGIITTVAGSGTPGLSGDGGDALSAQFYGVNSLSLDAAGNIYFSDINNLRVRKITKATNIITTVAGGGAGSGDGVAATSVFLSNPSAITVNPGGDIFIAQTGNHKIRKVTAATGLISTIAGTGTAGFSGDNGAATLAKLNSPTALTLDVAGNLYVADKFNSRIRKIDATTNIITTIAGSGTYGFAGDGGPALAARLSYVYGLSADRNNNLYIADADNKRIRMLPLMINVVPLRLVSFSGRSIVGGNQLSWHTENELNTARYEIEKSNDGINFVFKAAVSANDQSQNYYSFTDAKPGIGSFYYRLKIIDADGRSRYSEIVVISSRGNNNGNIVLSPNPSNGKNILVKIASPVLLPQLYRITDMSGRVIQTGTISAGDQKISVQSRAAGTLVFTLADGGSQLLVIVP